MTVFLALLLSLYIMGSIGVFRSLSVEKSGQLSREVTSTINGFFVCLVFLRHLLQYVDAGAFNALDSGFRSVDGFLGQLIVSTFLLFSGYGVMESIKRKGNGYVLSLPRRRILPFLLDVWLALAVYVAVRLIRGSGLPSVSRLLLSMVGWEGIGNSNWYIFAVLCLWVFTYLSFRIFQREDQRWLAIAMTAVFTLCYCFVMKREEAGARFYNTVFCYLAGMVLSLLIDHLRDMAHPRESGAIAAVALFAAFYLLRQASASHVFFYNARAIVFALLVALGSLLQKSVSKPFLWIGNNLFFIYIYQRVPMILLQPLAAYGTLVYGTVCFICTIALCMAMAPIHKRWQGFFAGGSFKAKG